jgi:CheY-like chemotaxis protein
MTDLISNIGSNHDTILIVDDNPDNLIVMTMVLHDLLPGAETVTFNQPEKALAYLQSSDVSLALIDVQMPGIDGIEMCRQLKASENTRDIPIILLTSHEASPSRKAKGLDAGADDFLSRPIDNLELSARVKVALRIHHAEVELRQSKLQIQHEYHMLFDKMNAGFAVHEMIFDSNGKPVDFRILTVNPAFERLTSLSAGDILSKTIREIMPDLKYEWIERYGRVVTTRESISFQDYLAPIDKHFEVSAFHVVDNEFAVSFTDVTERIRAEDELHRMQKLKSLGTLAGGIAHDFNNILMGVFGNIQLTLESLSEDNPNFKSLAESAKSIDRATRLTNQLLTFARGGMPVKEIVDLGELVTETVRFDLSGSNVSPVFQQDQGLWRVNVDIGQMQQVISNLTINADQAMPDGGKLSIHLANVTLLPGSIANLSEGKYIKITVRDEGVGIDKKNLKLVFDPYFTTKSTGCGLGLATTHSIINQHGGAIKIDSTPGKGTTFTLYLPASDSPVIESIAQPSEAIFPPPEETAKILVMDDEEAICNLMTKMLEKVGYTVNTALDGRQAIEMYQLAIDSGDPFDAVIMDLTIPGGVGGQDSIKELLNIDQDAKCIVSSGYANNPIMANYKEYGFKGVIAKPFSPSELREMLHQVLRG